jgi:glycosyltransferase involved in cell wall biosynthesis
MYSVPGFYSKKVLFYHNVTPYKYWVDINPLAAFHCYRGMTDLARVAGNCSVGVAFSEFSMRDLKSMGLKKCMVLPIKTSFNGADLLEDAVTLRLKNGKRKRVLVVGRIAPNKKIEDALRIVSFLPNVQLTLIGSTESARPYYYALREMAEKLQIHCEFVGHVSQEELHAYFRNANALLITSEHEGFCVPVLEAFRYRVPVVARAAGAIPETTRGGALLFDESEGPESVAGALQLVLNDPQLRSALTTKGNEVLQEHLSISYREKIKTILAHAI